MAATPLKRKLVAILAADAVGYSRLMAADEEGTMKVLGAHRAVIDGIIEFHEGRIVGTAGDSVLAEFASPTEAVRCAVEIQDAMRTRNDSLAEDKRLHFRIGVNLGDVMVKGDDLLGDGVNVAARLEGIAEPGGICISSSVYDQIAGKLNLGFVDIGAQALKNINRPVRVYRVERDGRAAPTAIARGRTGIRRGKWAAVAAVLVIGAGLAWYFKFLSGAGEAERMAAAKEAGAARAKIERELATARAEAEAARQRAQSEAAAAAEAKRALEQQRAAEARARAEAEVARARAEAEALRRKTETELAAATRAAESKRRLEEQRAAEAHARAEAELAAAKEARRAAEIEAKTTTPAATTPATAKVVASAATLRDGRWLVEIACPAFENFRERSITIPLLLQDDALIAQHGTPDAPLSLSLRGVQAADGSLWLRGKGVSGQRAGARPYPAGFFVQPVADRFEGRGRLGKRQCTAVISRAP